MDIEIELAWGLIDKKMNREKVRIASERARALLDDVICLLEKYNIPVTWGILGHVILDHCECNSGVPHTEMPRPSYRWMKRDWYEHDPCKNLRHEPAFYGKDITDKIVDYTSESKIPHDIACHSFSHQLFGDPGCSKEVAEAEVKRCLELMEENYGIKPYVFIFPRDYQGHHDVLRRNGFVAFRGRSPRILTYSELGTGVWNAIRKRVSSATRFLSFYLAIPSLVVDLREEHGLINIPASVCYNKKRFMPLRLIVLNAKKGIKKAVKERRVFHLYTHLINFGDVPDAKTFLDGFEEILSYANSCRMANKLEIVTMRAIAETYQS